MDILDAYNQIAGRQRLPALQRGGLEALPTPYTDPRDLWDALRARAPRQGWLQFQSHQCIFTEGLPEPQADWGVLLAAEAAVGEDESITVAIDGAGGWILTRYRHHADGDLLWDETSHRARHPQIAALRYRRYWRYDPQQGYVQQCACFFGFN